MKIEEIILWVIGIGFTFNFGLMLVIWNSLNHKIDGVNNNLSNRIEKMDEKITDIDRRLCRLEGAFSSKDCCMIKDDRQLRKIEE